ncbi:sensor histidine kinase [Frankia gtarii]|uniref:sensor histidine kinase n=1 Tax=Frankia gtarii TaxID=2950102 RepID=UPI0021BF8B90|nr:ATP-binding protein [Frankia gtarii]
MSASQTTSVKGPASVRFHGGEALRSAAGRARRRLWELEALLNPDVVPSEVLNFGLRRAGAGLVVAAACQTAFCLVTAGFAYSSEFIYIAFPLLIVGIAVGSIGMLSSLRPAIWVAAMCGIFAVFSVLASVSVAGEDTGATNVAEPLVGLGVFNAGLSRSRVAYASAVLLIAAHRSALVAAGTGAPTEHAVLTALEVGSFVASIAGTAGVRRLAPRLDDAAERDTREVELHARHGGAEHLRAVEGALLVHDGPLDALTLIGNGIIADSPEFRELCRSGAAQLTGLLESAASAIPAALAIPPGSLGSAGLLGSADLSDSSGSAGAAQGGLAEGLDELGQIFRGRGLTVEVSRDGDAHYPVDVAVTTAFVLAIREALTNVIRHAGVDRAAVHAVANGQTTTVAIIDRGRGFSRLAGVPGDRVGLRGSIIRRLEAVGGAAEIDSAAGRGTTVTLRWPG